MSKKQKIINIILFIAIFFFSLSQPIFAQKEKFVVNINPVRGLDFWKLGISPTDYVNFQKEISQKNNFPITWLIRPDFYLPSKDNYFQDQKFKNDDLGIFLEVTPSWTKPLNIDYKSNLPWYHSQNIFLSGYNPSDRVKLIDYAFENFKNIFGYYPKSVGAWHIDPTSAQYLVKKYQVNNFLICADQTATDGYQIWGGWWGIPYYPSKDNLLIPAAKPSDKLNAVIIFWAQRDPVNGYGEGRHSLYSLQANDYSQINLKTDYFHKISDIYLNQTTNNFGQVTIGLENDNYPIYKSEYQNQINDLQKTNSKFITSSQFADWYLSQNPSLSPSVEITGSDPLDSATQFKWILKTDSRQALFKTNNNDWQTKDFRQYQGEIDDYQYYRNTENVLNWKILAKIDSVLNSKQDNPTTTNYHFVIVFSAIILLVLVMYIFKKIKLIPTIVVIVGSLVLSLTMIRSGINYKFGYGFWGPNGHDGIWHLSLINQLQQSIPPKNPVFSGTILNNYHWGFDLFAAAIGKIFNNNSFVYFQLLPIVFALLIGLFSYQLIEKDTKNSKNALLFVLVTYFSGSFGWIYTLIKSKTIHGESLFWSMQSASTLINPPFALSLIFILIGLILWTKNYSTKKYSLAVLIGIIFGLLAGIKVYSGILVGLTLVIIWLIDFIKTKKIINFNFFVWVTTLFVSLVFLTLLGVLQGSSLLEFKPLWFVHSMIESIDKFYFPKLAAYRINLSQNLTLIKFPFFIAIESVLILIFLVGNMGFRILGFESIYQKIKHHNFSNLEKFSLILMFISFIIPMLFVQKGTAWNTIQFFYYFLFFSNIFFAQKLTYLIKSKQISKIFIAVLILFFSNITTYSTIKDYLGNPPPSAIPQKEVQALNFLKNQPSGVVLTFPYDKFAKDKLNMSTPIPMYLYETTAYVSAYSNKQVFLEDQMNLDITGFDWQSRRKLVDKFFNSNDQFFARGFLVDNQINYIYLINSQKFTLGPSQLQIEKIFDNGPVQIYKVQR